jgi:hypothetical protein
MKMEYVRERIRNVPPLSQPGLNIEVLVAGKEIIKKQTVNALRLGVQAHSRIEIRRATLDDHGQGASVRLRPAGNEGQE